MTTAGTLLNLLTPAEARDAVGRGATDTKNQAVFDLAVTAVSEMLADKCGPIVYGTITGELHDGGKHYLYLNKSPVQGVVQVVEYDETTAGTLTAETNASKPDNGYTVNLENGRIRRRSGNADARFPIGNDNVRVTYVAGRYTTTATVDEKFKLAAALTLKNGWRAWEAATVTVGEFDVPQASFPTFSVPNAVKELLGKEWRSGSGIGD